MACAAVVAVMHVTSKFQIKNHLIEFLVAYEMVVKATGVFTAIMQCTCELHLDVTRCITAVVV